MMVGKILPRYFYISSSPNKNVCTIYVYIFPAINNLVCVAAKNIIVFRVKVLYLAIKATIWPPYKMNVKAVISRLKTINTYNMECVGGWKWKVGQIYILDHSHVIKSKKWKWAKGKWRPKQWTYSRHCDKIFHGLW